MLYRSTDFVERCNIRNIRTIFVHIMYVFIYEASLYMHDFQKFSKEFKLGTEIPKCFSLK